MPPKNNLKFRRKSPTIKLRAAGAAGGSVFFLGRESFLAVGADGSVFWGRDFYFLGIEAATCDAADFHDFCAPARSVPSSRAAKCVRDFVQNRLFNGFFFVYFHQIPRQSNFFFVIIAAPKSPFCPIKSKLPVDEIVPLH